MEIQAGTVPSTISLTNLIRATSGQSKVSFPVSSGDIAYANFKNIKIVPSGNSQGTYSVSRLRALDNLIEQLNRMKGQNKIETPDLDGMGPDAVNSLISEFSNEVHNKLETNTPYMPSLETTGLFVNMLL